MVGRRTCDQNVASSTPGQGAIKSTIGNLNLPSLRGIGKSSTSLRGWVRRGAFTCVRWKVTVCDPIRQVTSRSSELGFPRKSYIGIYLSRHDHINAQLDIGQVHERVGMDWVGSRFFPWVGSGPVQLCWSSWMIYRMLCQT